MVTEIETVTIGPGLLKRLTAPGARERFEFNLSIMSGRTDLDLGLLDGLTEVIALDESFAAAERILAGRIHGRTVVDVRR